MKKIVYKNINLTNPVHLLAVGLGSGLIPKSPGTMGSIASIIIWYLFNALTPIYYWLVIAVAFIVGCWICHKTAEDMGVDDPGSIVWDEFIGMWITLFFIPEHSWQWILVAFLAFRCFDIFKPWPIRWFDRQVKGGIGIMLDDVIAAVFAVVIVVILKLFID
ncbi:MAG: phosphatidylglycerophosphatase A [Candidatus Schmidhempelia sp.]|nr:phosphatidylglycerophosphatase A [Candidatus Schmidhempelia sp.]